MMAFRADQGPQALSALLDQQVYFTGILGIDIASRKVQWAVPDETTIRLAREAVNARKGWTCAEDPVVEDSPVWDGATEIPSTKELSYLVTDIGTETPARCPKKLPGVRVATEAELSRLRGPADMVTTVIRTVVMTRWYSVANAYRPGKQQHKTNNAHQLRIFTRSTGMSVHTKQAAAWAPWKASGMGLIRAEDQYVVTALREWMRHHY